MIRYHIVNVFRPALFLVLCGIGLVTVIVYRSGGPWTGRALSYAIVLQYWSAITTFLLPGLVATTPPLRSTRVDYDPLVVARPSYGRAVRDTLTRLLAMVLPVVLVGIGASIFFTLRIGDIVHARFNSIDRPNPLTVETLWLVFLIGPLPGSVLLLAISEIVGSYFWGNTLRIVVVGFVAALDAMNRLRDPLLSLSGTALGVVQTACCSTRLKIESISSSMIGSVFGRGAYWGIYIYDQQGRPFEGPITADISMSLIIARVLLLSLAIVLMIGLGIMRARQLNVTFNEA